MTPPRCVIPGRTVEITRRTLRREFRILPHREISQLFLYVLGVVAERTGVELYGLAVMVNHYHVVVRDTRGEMPMFQQRLNSVLAKALNAYQGRNGQLWSQPGYRDVHPQAQDDVIRKLVYGMVNPVEAGLVNRIEDYPGLVITPDDIGRDIVVERPEFYFSERGSMPPTVTLRFGIPPEFFDMGLGAYRKLLWERIRTRERELRVERKASGKSVVGTKRLRQVAVGQRATSWEAWFTLRPSVAARQTADRVAAIRALKQFRDAYRVAWAKWSDGDRGVTFPEGTWWLPRYAGAKCATAPKCPIEGNHPRNRPSETATGRARAELS